jgi:hypothetical protein
MAVDECPQTARMGGVLRENFSLRKLGGAFIYVSRGAYYDNLEG